MNKRELLQDFVTEFSAYIAEWKRLDAIRMHWIFRTVLYIPFGFCMSMNVLRMKHNLTKKYEEYLKRHEELVLEANRLCSERN